MTAAQIRDKEATRAQILAAALTIFAEKGFRASSVSEIATAAGVTKSLIHHHFGSKEALWRSIKERHFREYFDAQMGLLGQPASAEQLERSVKAYFRFLRDDPRFGRLMAWMQLERTEGQSFPLGEQLTREAIRKIREAQDAGQLRPDIHPFSILVSFLALAEHWFQAKEIRCQGLPADDEARSDERYLKDMLEIFLRGVLPRSASD